MHQETREEVEDNMDLGGVVGMIEHLEGLAKEKDQ